MSKILYVPEHLHRHYVEETVYVDALPEPAGFIPGTTAVCSGCGKTVVYDCDFGGPLEWVTEGWFHRLRRMHRQRKQATGKS